MNARQYRSVKTQGWYHGGGGQMEQLPQGFKLGKIRKYGVFIFIHASK